MAAGPEITFGCGAYLPGEGPFNFDDTMGGIILGTVDNPLDGTGIPPGTGIGGPGQPPGIGPPPEGWDGPPFPGGVIVIGPPFRPGCNVDGALNYDDTANGCSQSDPTNFDCCEFLDGCPDPLADNYVTDAWGCGGTYEDQGNTDCCTYDGGPDLSDPIINVGGGDIVPGYGPVGGPDQGPTGPNYGEVIELDMPPLYYGLTNPTGQEYSIFTPTRWDLNGAGVSVQGTGFLTASNGTIPGSNTTSLYSNFAPTPPWHQNAIFQGNTGLIGVRHFTSEAGTVGAQFNGDPCQGVPASFCNFPLEGMRWVVDWTNPWSGHTGFFFLIARTPWVATLMSDGGDDPTRTTISIPKLIKRIGSALLPKKEEETSRETLISNAVKDNRIDLNSSKIKDSILADNPTGLMDADIAYMINPKSAELIANDTGSSDLFGDQIDENVSYIVKNNEYKKDWDATRARGVTMNAIMRSLTPEALRNLTHLKNYDGTPLTLSQKYSMIGSRILDGTLGNINQDFLQKLAVASDELEDFTFIRSSSDLVNDTAALAYIERHYVSLDPSKSEGTGRLILPNWKVFATDVDKHIEIRLADGTLQKFYVKDDNTLVDRSNIKVQDGDFVEVKVGGVTKRFFCKSEIDHAFYLPERVRMKAVNLMGGDSSRTLSVSTDTSSNIEFDYSLTSPRQNFYVLSAVLSSTVTEPSEQGSYFLKDTKLTYELTDTSSVAGLAEVNKYIRYKANSRTFIIDDDDRMLDYIEATGKVELRQTDILCDAPKTDKATPLLVRQIPWYIIVYPTNRAELNPLNAKSVLLTYDSSSTSTRYLRTGPSLAPEFNDRNLNSFNKQVIVGTDYPDARGNFSTQTRITKISADEKVFQTGYRKNNVQLGSAQSVNPPKLKTTFRLIKEIITELNTNYILEWNSLGRTLTTFDVISRLTLKEFSKFVSIENYRMLFPLIKKGVIENVKVFEPTAFASTRLTDKKTQLVQRKSNAVADTFPPIKSMATGYEIAPPRATGGPSFRPIERQPVTPP
jgi:hypothetical protein